jgi:hypothetical protein
MELYVKAKCKKNINERIASGEAVYGTNYSMFGGGGVYRLDESVPDGTIVKVYDKMVGGSPYAKAYGTWRQAKRMVVCVVLMLLASGVQAQTIRRDAEGNYVQVPKSKAEPKRTGHWYKDSKGKTWDVYVTEKGRLFVIKTSAKTGKEYRYYLPVEDDKGYPVF